MFGNLSKTTKEISARADVQFNYFTVFSALRKRSMNGLFFLIALALCRSSHIRYKSSLISVYTHQLDTSSKSYSTFYEATFLKRLLRHVSRTLRIGTQPLSC